MNTQNPSSPETVNGYTSSPSKTLSALTENVGISTQYHTPKPEPVSSFAALKGRIRHHYELASDYYFSLW